MVERFQKRFTSERMHRCHDCNWRGWGLETTEHTERQWSVVHHPPDLAAIDAALAVTGRANGDRPEENEPGSEQVPGS